MKIIYLSEDEEKALRLLTEQASAYTIRDRCKLPLSGLAIFTSEIRRKTGIRDTKNPKECQSYIRQYEAAMAAARPTEDEIWLLRHFCDKDTIEGITYQWNALHLEQTPFTEDAIRSAIEQAFEHIGIFSKDERARRMQFRYYLAAYRPQKLPDTGHQWEFLRHTAAGLTVKQIADLMNEPLDYVQAKIEDACIRVGLKAKGRDVQRNLIRVFLHLNDPLNDPMF
jgi:hypothetical protein